MHRLAGMARKSGIHTGIARSFAVATESTTAISAGLTMLRRTRIGGVHVGVQLTGHVEKGDHRQCGDYPQNALRHRYFAGRERQAGGRNGGACGNDAEHRGGE